MIFQMALHGVPEDKINKLKHDFKDEAETEPKNIRIPITEFKGLGLAFGKINKTKVKR